MVRRVLIVDDNEPFRSVARRLLERDGFDVVGEADTGRSALDAVDDLRPDLVLLDVQLPDLDGFGVCERLLANGERPSVILISSRPASAYRRRLPASGAIGFITKADLVPGALDAVLGASM